MTDRQFAYLKLRLRPAVEGHVLLRDRHTGMFWEIASMLEDTYDPDCPMLIDAAGGHHFVDEIEWSDVMICDSVPNARRM